MTESLTHRTIHGIKWSYISTIITTGLQIVYTAIMARLLEPSDFGLVAMGWMFLRFGQYFSQFGIGQVIIQKEVLIDEDISTGFSFSIISGILFTSLFILLTPLGCTVFNEPELKKIIYIISFSFIVEGILVTPLSLFRRKLQFKKIAIYEIISFIVGYFCFGVVLALFHCGFWSLIFATITQRIIYCIMLLCKGEDRIGLKIYFNRLKSLLNLGGQYSVIGFFQFLGYLVPPFFIGKFFGAYSLGLYNNSSRLSNLPMESFSNSLLKVLFPSFSTIQSDIVRLKKVYLFSLLSLCIIIIPVSLGMLVAAHQIVLVVLGSKWIEAISIFEIFCIITPFTFFIFLNGIILDSIAKLKIKIFIEIVFFAAITIGFYLLRNSNVKIYLLIYLSIEIIRSVIYFITIKKMLSIHISEYLKVFWKIFKHTSIILISIWIVKNIVALLIMNNLISFLSQILIGMLSLIFSFCIFKDEFNKEMLEIYYRIIESIDRKNPIVRMMNKVVVKFV